MKHSQLLLTRAATIALVILTNELAGVGGQLGITASAVHAGGLSATAAGVRAGPLAAEPLHDYVFFLPPGASTLNPMRILVALHGMGGNGPEFARSLLPAAERLGWAVLAPTMPYNDYRDPELVKRDGELLPKLKSLIEAQSVRTGLRFDQRVVVFGFSRGSQEAHRYALMYPELVAGVAGIGAGSYTLPTESIKALSRVEMLPYPFGTANVDQICGRAFRPEAARMVNFWIAVGGRDDRPADVPRQWDQYVGTNRVERAQRFVSALQQFGAHAEFALYPQAAHEVTDQMRDDGFRFLAGAGAPTIAVGAR